MQTIKLIFFITCAITAKFSTAQIPGCTDHRANNFNASATLNDGSCMYNPTAHTPKKLVNKLSDTVNGTSALMIINDDFWTLNDDGHSNAIYRFDSYDGHILQSIFLRKASKYDWESMAIDAQYKHIYIGNMGNNFGNRTDLAIYKIYRSDITKKAVDTIDA